jgi:hypothetical protein
MNFSKYKALLLVAGLSLMTTACFKDLNTIPLDKNQITSATVFNNPDAYKQVLAKLYAGLAVSGQQGPAGQPDISGIDEGFSTYLRQFWNAQELTTDEAVIGWNDGTIKTYHWQTWNSQNEFITAMYNRIFYQISICNEYLRQTTDAQLSARGVTDPLKSQIVQYRAEARFLRALSYWHALDMFRNVPFVTELDNVGAFSPKQIQAADLYKYVESELKAIDGDLAAPHSNEYGRADRAAAWTVLAKLYLNSEAYIGQKSYTQALDYCSKVIAAGYTLTPEYKNLFLADNNTASGIIFAVNFDGVHTKTYGGMTYLVHAGVGGSMKPSDYGIDGGWGGTRVTSAFVAKFPSVGASNVIVAPNAGHTADYPKLQVPGNYQGWDPTNTSTVLSSANNDNKFEGYAYFPAATEFKFTVGTAWDVNYGDTGADGTLDAGGDNIKVADEGYYKINVDLTAKTYTLLKTSWGLIGSAAANGWNSDSGTFTWDATAGALVITADLVAGDVKFRANQDWGLNYGDNNKDGLLQSGGNNIAIPGNGKYKIKLFLTKPDYTYSIELVSFDSRALFYTSGQNLDITDITQFTDGYAVSKYKNVTSAGVAGSDPTFVDNDFPMFRIEDIYLMYAEAHLRGGGGDDQTALDYVNLVRGRAYHGTAGNIKLSDLNLDFILDERARELYWEGHRRTDLIRFGKFSNTSYVWQWKGNTRDGVATDGHFDVFPIPASDIGANPNLKQNTGY